MGLKERRVVFILSNSCLSGDQWALFYALGTFLHQRSYDCYHKENALQAGRKKEMYFPENTDARSAGGRCRCRILFRNRSCKTHFWPLRTKLSNTICSNNNLNSRSWTLTINHMWSRVSKQTECYRCVMRFIVMVSANASDRSCLQPPLKSLTLYEKLKGGFFSCDGNFNLFCHKYFLCLK